MRTFSTGRQAIGLGVWILVSFAAAAIGGVASARSAEFYLMLDRPAWAPPAGLFGPVWSVLYTLQGIAAWLVWREGGFRKARTALLLFLAQLLVNGLWTWLFFVWRLGGLAFGEILVLLMMIVATMVLFARVRRLAAWLLLPYLLWVSFASALTWSIWHRNVGALSENSGRQYSHPPKTAENGVSTSGISLSAVSRLPRAFSSLDSFGHGNIFRDYEASEGASGHIYRSSAGRARDLHGPA